MRWESLFADMEAQLEAARRAELRDEVAELTRAERATVGWADRLRGSAGHAVQVRVDDGDALRGVLTDAAEQWALLDDDRGRQLLVPTAAVLAVAGLSAHAEPAAGRVERALGLGHTLRALARDRQVVRVRSRATELVGRIERVGADHLDLVDPDGARAVGGSRSAGAAPRAWTVPFAAVLVVASG